MHWGRIVYQNGEEGAERAGGGGGKREFTKEGGGPSLLFADSFVYTDSRWHGGEGGRYAVSEG